MLEGDDDMTRIAVAIVHGVGVQDASFAEPMIEALVETVARELDVDETAAATLFAFEPVHWAPILSGAQTRLWRRVSAAHELDYTNLRRFMIDFLGDGIAYQPTGRSREVYDAVHTTMAQALHTLASGAGPAAPLCVIAHSLGTVIASNYFYDLGRPDVMSDGVAAHIADSPLERGETLTHFHTMGSPLAIWGLHDRDFGQPIAVPSKKLGAHHPGLRGGWVNFFDEDDVIAYPLKPLNDAYDAAVLEDVAVHVGGVLTGATPLAHNRYWTDDGVTARIAQSLADLSRSLA